MYLQLLIAAALAAAAASSSWWITKEHYQHVIADAKVEALAALKVANDKVDVADARANTIDVGWQKWASEQRVQIVYRDRKVAAAFKAAPVWSAEPIPDAVRVQLVEPAAGASQAANDPRRADGAMPAASAASAPDQPGSGAGVSGVKGFFGRLFSSP